MATSELFTQLCTPKTLLDAWKSIRQKGAAGGIDGITIETFENDLDSNIAQLLQELESGTWKPEPYFRICIPKKDNETRKLGLLCIRDKIVQQAIKRLVEPRFEKIFVSNSYGYRPGKGHTKAIRFASNCFKNKKYPYILRMDIDNYFDNIDHEILFKRIAAVIPDDNIHRLIELCVKMGVVSKSMKWEEASRGVPQGAILSPVLSNFYLHPFDQFVLTRTKAYVRYADDFLIGCESSEHAERLQSECSAFLENRLTLKLNPPSISEIKNGVEFLGITMDSKGLSISVKKKEDLISRIKSLVWDGNGFNSKGLEAISAIQTYYGRLLSDTCLTMFDTELISHLKNIVTQSYAAIPNKTTLSAALKEISFYSSQNILNSNTIKSDIINTYILTKSSQNRALNQSKNKSLILKRKKEYRRLENESSELVVNSFGCHIGITGKGIALKATGKKKRTVPAANLHHITILCDGVSISSNAIRFCMDNKIGIDFFSRKGQHYASVLNDRYIHTSLWQKQVEMSISDRNELAAKIICAKLKNQLNLIKYYNKYHKETSDSLKLKFDEASHEMTKIQASVISLEYSDDFPQKLLTLEAKGAELYWGYIKELIKDDGVEFSNRIRHGATDLINCLLNYGYAILYARIWQMLLYRKLNPSQSVIHVQQSGKPTLVYDIIELFRAQAVDRVVISMIQKHEPLSVVDGRIDDKSKGLLIQNIVERLNRYEKYRGKETRLCDIIDLQVKEIADYINGGDRYKPYIAKW